MKVLVSGASGFVGTSLMELLSKTGSQVVGVSRRVPQQLPKGVTHKIVDIGPNTQWGGLFEDVKSVVHLADGFNAFERFEAGTKNQAARLRFEATLNMARAAIEAGVKNLTYLSTIKAMAGSWAGEILNENSPARPASLYGELKLAAEQEILRLASASATRVINLRFPLVFGAKADGNFTRLLQLADSGLPLPFLGVTAKRSLISLTSLCDAIARTIDNETAPAGTYLVQDAAMSLSELLGILRSGMGRPARLFYLPPALMAPLVFMPGTRGIATRLLRPLEMNDRLFREKFCWQPPVKMRLELEKSAIAFKSGKKK